MLQVVGKLRSEVAEQLGLDTDVIVAPGSGDNQMSALGAGAVKEGSWVISLGTSGKSELNPTMGISNLPTCQQIPTATKQDTPQNNF